jgi:hypothetical protein
LRTAAPFKNTLSKQQIENVAAHVTPKVAKLRPRLLRCDAGACAHNDQGGDLREERRDAQV